MFCLRKTSLLSKTVQTVQVSRNSVVRSVQWKDSTSSRLANPLPLRACTIVDDGKLPCSAGTTRLSSGLSLFAGESGFSVLSFITCLPSCQVLQRAYHRSTAPLSGRFVQYTAFSEVKPQLVLTAYSPAPVVKYVVRLRFSFISCVLKAFGPVTPDHVFACSLSLHH